MELGRRRFAKALAGAGIGLALDRWLSAQSVRSVSDGRLVRMMPLGRLDRRPAPPMHTLLGSGLDARQFADLSMLDPEHLVTPTEHFYIRTAHPPQLPAPDGWSIACGGLAGSDQTLRVHDLERDAKTIGVRLMECAGNADPANFGLLSAAQWAGVPMSAVLDRLRPKPGLQRIRVTGIDDDKTPSVTSNPGASWIFTLDELQKTGAFLALRMNDAPLTLDHGAPIRLVVPNYFGCSCIKWVSRIDWVTDDAPATLQMMEFSARTHQGGVFKFARDYTPPAIELAATPVRVEQWLVTRNGADRIVYRVVGVRWGGWRTSVPLTIRFASREAFVPVQDVPDSSEPGTWSLWSHEWTPSAPGRYQIALGVSDTSIPARRLDLYYYTRDVDIDRI
ncbi:MAG: molybdopterin-dependent oxidoreductase [Vicinamibacterales bacterium]